MKIINLIGSPLGSPNYIFQVSAQMKAFMDRCCQAIHCLSFEGNTAHPWSHPAARGVNEQKP